MSEDQKVLIKKRQELVRAHEHLQEPDLSSGMARELRGRVALLERGMAELKGEG